MTNKTAQVNRVAYEASPTEMATIAQIQNHLSNAFGKHATITTQDAITFSVLVACEVLDICQSYSSAMPNPDTASETRLARHLKYPVRG